MAADNTSTSTKTRQQNYIHGIATILITDGIWQKGFLAVPSGNRHHGRGFIPTVECGQKLYRAAGFVAGNAMDRGAWWIQVEPVDGQYYGMARAYYQVMDEIKLAAEFLSRG